MSKKKVPKNLQPYLWSVNVKNLDLEEDKIYIINQILAYGEIEEWQWLFKVYPKKIIQKVFLQQPIKIYYKPDYYFIKDILFGLKQIELDPYKYDTDLPRLIRH